MKEPAVAKRPILKLFLISFAICFVLMIAGIIAAVIMFRRGPTVPKPVKPHWVLWLLRRA